MRKSDILFHPTRDESLLRCAILKGGKNRVTARLTLTL